MAEIGCPSVKRLFGSSVHPDSGQGLLGSELPFLEVGCS